MAIQPAGLFSTTITCSSEYLPRASGARKPTVSTMMPQLMPFALSSSSAGVTRSRRSASTMAAEMPTVLLPVMIATTSRPINSSSIQ